MSKVFYEKSYINGTQPVENEQDCKKWFLSADPCLCNIEFKPRLKPKQLFWGECTYFFLF